MRAYGVIAVAGAMLLGVQPALADAIDGAWCREGKRFTITGPAIVTSGGLRMQGDYSRHAFSYVAPAGEANPGGTVSMRLVNEDTVQLRQGAEAPAETWQRCGPPIS